MVPSPFMNDYDLDLSTGGFDEFDKEITDPLTIATIPVVTTKKQHTKQRKSVSFYPRLRIHDTISIDDYTEEEHRAAWFSFEEMERIRKCTKSEAGLLDAGVQPKESTCRGLESRTKLGEKAKRRNRTNAYAAVFFEVDSQEQSGQFSEQLIADAYALYSKACERSALAMAKEDAKAAMAIYHETQNPKTNKKHTKQPRTNSIDLATHFRKTKKLSVCKPLVTLAPTTTVQ